MSGEVFVDKDVSIFGGIAEYIGKCYNPALQYIKSQSKQSSRASSDPQKCVVDECSVAMDNFTEHMSCESSFSFHDSFDI